MTVLIYQRRCSLAYCNRPDSPVRSQFLRLKNRFLLTQSWAPHKQSARFGDYSRMPARNYLLDLESADSVYFEWGIRRVLVSLTEIAGLVVAQRVDLLVVSLNQCVFQSSSYSDSSVVKVRDLAQFEHKIAVLLSNLVEPVVATPKHLTVFRHYQSASFGAVHEHCFAFDVCFESWDLRREVVMFAESGRTMLARTPSEQSALSSESCGVRAAATNH